MKDEKVAANENVGPTMDQHPIQGEYRSHPLHATKTEDKLQPL